MTVVDIHCPAHPVQSTVWWDEVMTSGTSNDPDFDQFFCDHFDDLVRSLTVITGDAEAARDCVQEAFVKTYARWRRIKRYDKPVTWVRRVAINLSRDGHRSDARRRRREDRIYDEANRLAPRGGESTESEIDVIGLLDHLSPRQRTVAALFYVEDISIAEIAASLRLSTGAVKFHLNKARENLKILVEQERLPS